MVSLVPLLGERLHEVDDALDFRQAPRENQRLRGCIVEIRVRSIHPLFGFAHSAHGIKPRAYLDEAISPDEVADRHPFDEAVFHGSKLFPALDFFAECQRLLRRRKGEVFQRVKTTNCSSAVRKDRQAFYAHGWSPDLLRYDGIAS